MDDWVRVFRDDDIPYTGSEFQFWQWNIFGGMFSGWGPFFCGLKVCTDLKDVSNSLVCVGEIGMVDCFRDE